MASSIIDVMVKLAKQEYNLIYEHELHKHEQKHEREHEHKGLDLYGSREGLC